ncbi:MAG: uncharacterized protein JWP41_124 [Ramlibacter sp.]|nr:uncharacterized protein [Ramlibacter sp.]
MKLVRLLAGLATGFVLAAGASAAGFPNHTVSLIVPYPAGGPSDVMARQIQPALQKALGQTLIVENFGGAGGLIGVGKVLTPQNDGHSVLMASPMELIQTPLAMSSAKFQPDDMRLAGMIINTDVILLARKDLPAQNVAELVALARKADGKRLSYGSVGKGSLYHLVGEHFAQKANVPLLHVPYRGGVQVLQDLAGGQIDIVFMPLAGPVLGMVQSGKVKALALAAGKRHPLFPQLPLVSETAGIGDFTFDIWAALAVPKTVPDEAVEKLQAALADALRQPEVRKELESTGPRVSAAATDAQMAQYYRQEVARYKAIAQAIGLKPE